MKSTSFRRALVPTAVLTLGFGLAACSASNEGDSGGDTGGDSGGGTSLSGTLHGAGATSQEKAQEAWRTEFQGMNSGVEITYDAIGSGDGRTQFISKGVSFAGSDSYLDDEEGELSDAKKRCGGEDPIEVPAYVSPIAVVYNLKGVDKLQLDAETISKIFDGKITKWNDPAIAANNPGVKLPDTTITPVHRSDDSGTTKNFTDYLGQVGNGAWSYEADDVWPIKGGAAGDGTEGLIAKVEAGDGTIGYADESAAGDLGQIAIKVGDAYQAPDAAAAAKVLAISKRVSGRPDVDMATDIDRTTTESGTYPLLLASYLIACQHYDNADEAALVQGYLSYIVSDEGQQAAADNAGSAPLEASVAKEAQKIVGAIAAK